MFCTTPWTCRHLSMTLHVSSLYKFTIFTAVSSLQQQGNFRQITIVPSWWKQNKLKLKTLPAIMNIVQSTNAERSGHIHKSSPAITDMTDHAQKGFGMGAFWIAQIFQLQIFHNNQPENLPPPPPPPFIYSLPHKSRFLKNVTSSFGISLQSYHHLLTMSF